MALPQSYVSVSRRPPDIEDYIDMLRRHRPWIIGPMFAGLIVATVVAFLWPDTFVSKATLRITPQRVSERLVPAEFTTQVTQRLTAMEQEILSRTTLEGIITDPSLDLYKRQRGQRPMEDIVSDMRLHDIEIKFVQTPGSMSTDGHMVATAFSISFSYPDKFKAQQVVRMLVSKFTEQNVTVLRDQAHLTTTFLEDELKQAQDKLNILDDKITQFKLQNNGKLPEELTSNTTMLNSLLLQQSQLSQALQNAMDRKSSLETALDSLRNQLEFVQNNAEDAVNTQQQVAVESQQLLTASANLQTLQEQLAGLRQIYGENNPEIKNLRARIASAQATKDNIEKEQQKKAANPPPAETTRKIPNKNALMQIVNLQGQVEQLKTSIVEAGGNVRLIQREQETIAKRISNYESRIEAAPLNERQWAALQRDHLLAQQDFDEKVKKRQAAETVQNMEEHKAGEQLEVLDPPSDPQQPTEPKRAQWAATGTAIGLFLGIVMAGAKEMKNTSLKNLKDVRAYTNLPVLSSIPLLENALLVRRKRRLFWVAWSSAFVFGSMAVLASVYYYFAGQR